MLGYATVYWLYDIVDQFMAKRCWEDAAKVQDIGRPLAMAWTNGSKWNDIHYLWTVQ